MPSNQHSIKGKFLNDASGSALRRRVLRETISSIRKRDVAELILPPFRATEKNGDKKSKSKAQKLKVFFYR
jgi:hypothetical protein